MKRVVHRANGSGPGSDAPGEDIGLESIYDQAEWRDGLDPRPDDAAAVLALLDDSIVASGSRSNGLPDDGAVVAKAKLSWAVTHDAPGDRARCGSLVAVSRLLSRLRCCRCSVDGRSGSSRNRRVNSC